MESLALVAVMVLLSILLIDAAAVGLTILGLRGMAICVGSLAMFAGLWLLLTLPGVNWLAVFSIGCGAFAIWRSLGNLTRRP